MPKRLIQAFSIVLAMSTIAAAQAYAPVVTVRVTLPDGQTKELSVPESGVVRVAAKDGAEYEFQPTILDSKPWNRVVVRIFKPATADRPTEIVGEIQVKTGEPAVASKTDPAFRIAVPKVSPPQGS